MAIPREQRRPRAPRVTLVTTLEMIERAVPKDSGHCIWADAVRAAVPDASRISVDLQTIRWTDIERGLRYVFLTPRTAQIDLVNFDQGIEPEPTSVQLRGGQVVRAGAADKKLPAGRIPARVELVEREGPSRTAIPERVGGRTPPIAALAHTSYAGRRREFGLRGLNVRARTGDGSVEEQRRIARAVEE